MSLLLHIAGLELEIAAAPVVREAVLARYERFVAGSTRPSLPRVTLQIGDCGAFDPRFERPSIVELDAASSCEVVLSSPVRGRFSLATRRGVVEEATGLGAVDALLRAALSLTLPLEGSVLLHAALIPHSEGDASVLCGASGMGKSTAAAHFGGVCDELVVLRHSASGLVAHATPYWKGSPFEAPVRQILCLGRGQPVELRRVTGIHALRALLPHVVRYASLPMVDRPLFVALGEVARAPVFLAHCPVGAAFAPFLAARLEGPGAAMAETIS